MAQITTRTASALNQALGAAFADIPGLIATLITGSGNILITFTASVTSGYGFGQQVYFRLTLDGQVVANSQRELYMTASETTSITFTWTLRPGSGQHVIALQGAYGAGATSLKNLDHILTIHEPGY